MRITLIYIGFYQAVIRFYRQPFQALSDNNNNKIIITTTTTIVKSHRGDVQITIIMIIMKGTSVLIMYIIKKVLPGAVAVALARSFCFLCLFLGPVETFNVPDKAVRARKPFGWSRLIAGSDL